MKPQTIVTAIACSALLVLGTDCVTFAATGDSLILDKANSADQTTTLKNTTATPVLSLQAKNSATPPLAVNSSAKVVDLNADEVDGMSANQIGSKRFLFSATGTFSSQVFFQVPHVPAGKYQMSYDLWAVGAVGTAADPELVQCFFKLGNTYLGVDTAVSVMSSNPAVSGEAFATLASASSLTLECIANGPSSSWSAASDYPVQVLLTPITGKAKSLSLARSSG